MKCLFRGWVTKNWRNVNERQSEAMRKINKILVRSSVVCYSDAWKQRNDVLHNPEYYKKICD